MTNRPILITGTHRSGKTWISKGIHLSGKTSYINEPLNKDSSFFKDKVKYWYHHINENNEENFKIGYDNIINNNQSIRSIVSEVGDYKKVIKEIYRAKIQQKLTTKRILIDDPFASVSIDWFQKHYDFTIIAVVRNPSAFISSLILRKFRFPFKDLLNQKILMDEKLIMYESEIKDHSKNEHDIIEEGILLWKIIYTQLLEYKKRYKNRILISNFEEVVRNPIDEFRKIYNHVEIPFEKKEINKIIKYMAYGNKNEEIENNFTDEGFHSPIKSQLKICKNVLTPDSINYINKCTATILEQLLNKEL